VNGQPPQNERACTFDAPRKLAGMDVSADICPVRDIPDVRWLMSIARRDMRGQLPRAGGTLDQPARLLDALDTTIEAMTGVD